MRRIAVLLIVFLAAATIKAQDNVFNIIFKQDFQNDTPGLYNVDEWRQDFNNPAYANGLDKTYIVTTDGTNKAMQWNYPKGSVSPSNGGGQFEPVNSAMSDEVYMSYNIKFKPGFDWVLGGKLPGLRGGPDTYGAGEQPSWSDGFSNGLMWGHDYNGQDDNGALYFYTYYQDMAGIYGDCRRWGTFKFQTDPERWYNITIRMVMNTVKSDGSGGNADGIMEGFIDGKLVVSVSGMRFRNVSTIHIDKMKMYSFFGGSGAEYGAARDEWTMIDDIYLFTYASGVNVPRGHTPSPAGRVLQLPNLNTGSTTTGSDTQAPSVPAGLKLSAVTESTASLSWNASTDNTGVKGYRIYVNGKSVVTTAGTSYKITGLNAGTTYSVTVTAYDAASNESAKSQALSITTVSVGTPDTQAPSVPAGLVLSSVTASTASLSWNASTDNTGVKGYRIYANGQSAGTTAGTSYKIAGLNAGTTYSVAVTAYDAASNESAKSQALSITTISTETPDTEAPSVPTGLVINGKTENTVSLSWSPSTDNVSVSGYIIFVDGTVKGTSPDTGFTINDLTANTSYSLSVLAYDASSNKSAESEAIPVTTENTETTGDSDPQPEDGSPKVSILEVHNDSENSAKSVSEISAFGNAELHNFGVIISENEDPSIGGNVYSATTGNYYVKNDNRVSRNLQVLYNFSEGGGAVIGDISGSGTPVDLTINNISNVKWLPGQGLKITGNAIISSGPKSADLINAISSTGEITLEAWIKSSDPEQSGPARIITLSADNDNWAATIGQTGDASGFDYKVRLKTTATSQNGLPESSTNDKYQDLNLQHVVFTRDNAGNEKIYVNGTERFSGSRSGDFSSWGDNYQLALANELTGNRPWKGTYFLVAVYNRALSHTEVSQNFKAGFGKLQFNSVLDNLEPDTHYFLAAFAETDLGIHYGEIVPFISGKNQVMAEDSIQLNVYPNPSDGLFRISFKYSKIDHATIRISDMNGKLIYSTIIPVDDSGMIQEKQLNLTDKLKNGIYFVTLMLGPAIDTKKLIIQK